jgi:hypothetical protein
MDRFIWNKIISYCLKIFQEISNLVKIWQEQHVLVLKKYVHLWQYVTEFFWEWEMFRIKVVEKIKTHILCSVTFSQKSYCLWDNVEKYCTAGQATDDSIIQPTHFASWVTKATWLTLRMCNKYCFSTGTVVMQTRVNIAFICALPVVYRLSSHLILWSLFTT